MPNSPCKNCKERQVGCHSHCEKYKQWSKAHLEEKARQDEQRKIDYYSVSIDDSINYKSIKIKERYRKGKKSC